MAQLVDSQHQSFHSRWSGWDRLTQWESLPDGQHGLTQWEASEMVMLHIEQGLIWCKGCACLSTASLMLGFWLVSRKYPGRGQPEQKVVITLIALRMLALLLACSTSLPYTVSALPVLS